MISFSVSQSRRHLIGAGLLFCAALAMPKLATAQVATSATPAPSAPATTPAATPATVPADPPPVNVTIYRYNSERTNSFDHKLQFPMSVAWQNTNTGPDNDPDTPVIDNGVLIYGCGKSVCAVNSSDGSIKWTFPGTGSSTTPGEFRCPATVADGKVFIGNDDKNLYVIDENTGAGLWQVATKGPVETAPLVDNGTVFFGSLDGGVYAIKESDQTALWGGVFHTMGPVLKSILVDSGFVYFVDTDNSVYCATEATGRLMWPYHSDNSVSDAPPILAGNTIYVGSDRNVIALAARTGSLKWITQLSAVVTASPSMMPDSNIMYVPCGDATVYALTTRGTVKWTITLDDAAAGPLTVTDNAVIVPEKSGVIVALDPDTGKQLWDFPLIGITPPYTHTYTDKGVLSSSILTTGDAIYALDNMGTLTALKTSAIDMVPPDADLQYPPTDKAVSGYEVKYKVKITDAGSGIDPSSTILTVDGNSIPTKYMAATGIVDLQKSTAGQLFGKIDVKIPKIGSGQHKLEFKASDWRGNAIDKTWYFTVDSSLDPPNTDDTQPGAVTKMGDSSTDSQPAPSNTVQPVNTASAQAPLIPGMPSAGGFSPTTAPPTPKPTTGGGGASSGGTTSSGGGGTTSGGSAPITNPLPKPPTNGGGTSPVGFPPPPPI